MPRTLAGRSWQAILMGDGNAAIGTGTPGTGDFAPADYIGVSANDDAFDEDNETLPGEVGSGDLARAQATFGHTEGQASYTLTKLFTSDQTIEIAKIGVFNAPSGGTLVFEELLDNHADLVDLDQVIFTVTVTL